MKPRILLLSAYDANSHRLWRERLAQLFPDYEWTQLALPPRHFNWRIRGNSLCWAFADNDSAVDIGRGDYELLIATSMVDLASLRGFIPALANIPNLVYFHENQFVYPASSQRKENIEPQLLQKLPDTPAKSILLKLEQSRVIPVPLMQLPKPSPKTSPAAEAQAADSLCLEVLWNHRWEHDKGPDLLLEVVRIICRRKIKLRLHIVGEQFRQAPASFAEIQQLLQRQQGLPGKDFEFGFLADPQRYLELLSSCDVVLSTALHDFQGLAIQEACVAGCTPLTPDDLVYPEYLAAEFLYPRADSHSATATGIVTRLMQWQQLKLAGEKLPKANLENYRASAVRKLYARIFSELTDR
jgi:glycosyltransferase involved in cell wall biosynthesis